MARILCVVGGLAAVWAAPVEARERLLSPVDAWQITRSEQSCLARRNFADPTGAPLRLDIEAFQPGRAYTFRMVGEALPLRDGRRRGVGFVRYRFKPDRDWREAYGLTGYVDGEDALSFQSDLATEAEASRLAELAADDQPLGLPPYRPDLARAAQVDQLALAYRTRDDTVLQLGPLGDPLAQLHACAQQLVAEWGYDPAVLDGQTSAPTIENREEINRHIQAAMHDGSVGQNQPVQLRLDVDASGRMIRCTVQAPRRNTPTEVEMCRILGEHSQIAPGRDAAGNPVAAPLFTRVVFGAWYSSGGIRLGRP